MDTVACDGITQQELIDAKTNIINNLKLRYENTAYVSLYNAKMLALFGYAYKKEDVIKNIEKS